MTDWRDVGRRLAAGEQQAADELRHGADGVADDDLWEALLGALDGADDDGTLWKIGDGLVEESVLTRPALADRWASARTQPGIAAVHRVMADPRWNWTNPEHWQARLL